MDLGAWEIDDLLTFPANTHDPSDGSASDADAVPSYRVYEDETATPLLTGTMALLDTANTVGFYSEQITLSTANGFELGKSYTIYISAAVNSTTGTTSHSFRVQNAVATQSSVDTIDTNVDAILVDTNELQTDWANGGRLDLILDARASQSSVDTIDGIVDAILVDTAEIGAAGAGLTALASQASVDTVDSNVDAILVDTGTTIPAQITALNDPTAAAIRVEIDSNSTQLAAIVADTNELQGDWVNGGRLDLILDARASQTSVDTVDSNVDAILVDTGTTLPASLTAIETDTQDIQSRLPSALVSGKMDSDATSISGSSTAADNLEASALGIVATTVNDASATTTSFVITSTETTDDHFNGRIIVFTSGALANQATDITDYVGSTRTVTVTALTEAPANGTTFVIV